MRVDNFNTIVYYVYLHESVTPYLHFFGFCDDFVQSLYIFNDHNNISTARLFNNTKFTCEIHLNHYRSPLYNESLLSPVKVVSVCLYPYVKPQHRGWESSFTLLVWISDKLPLRANPPSAFPRNGNTIARV